MNNLDLHSIQIAMDLVREMQSDRQITTLISGHHLEDIEPLCDTYYRVENGRIERI